MGFRELLSAVVLRLVASGAESAPSPPAAACWGRGGSSEAVREGSDTTRTRRREGLVASGLRTGQSCASGSHRWFEPSGHLGAKQSKGSAFSQGVSKGGALAAGAVEAQGAALSQLGGQWGSTRHSTVLAAKGSGKRQRLTASSRRTVSARLAVRPSCRRRCPCRRAATPRRPAAPAAPAGRAHSA